jgi:hypothetical protein
MIEKEFAPYTEALELKQLGFDERCLAWYGPNGRLLADITIGYEKTDWLYNQQDMDNPRECIAPTYSQAFRWFRENHKFSGVPTHQSYDIYNMQTGECFIEMYPIESYEEAELACLIKLIEIVKNNYGNL